MNNDIAISVRNLSKAYTIAHNAEKHTMLSEAIMQTLRQPFRRQEKETFWALRDINFDVKKGDVVGIIGRNGAGKSTLLKVLSRITEPTTGEIRLYGRVGSLLEVGTGFHPELTGRENIYLNGAILGMKRREIDKKFDEIVDFAGVEKFLDTPVKRYSSGMYVRLAFAVSAHLNPEILIVDEVLSVGDAEFQKKCLGKMGEVAKSGRTVLFVSHNMDAVRRLCKWGFLLVKGTIDTLGYSDEIVNTYINEDKISNDVINISITKNLKQLPAYVYRISIENENGNKSNSIKVGEGWKIIISINVNQSINGLVVGLGIITPSGIPLRTSWTSPISVNIGEYDIIFSDNLIIMEPGIYNFTVGLSFHGNTFQYLENIGSLQIINLNCIEDITRFQRVNNCGSILNPMNIKIIGITGNDIHK